MIRPIKTTRIGERDDVRMTKNLSVLTFCPLLNTRCISVRRLAQVLVYASTTRNRIFSMAIARAPVHYC